jgi:HD-GYP domain-containing protein (c-di-GMP phosphodiesterase class II)
VGEQIPELRAIVQSNLLADSVADFDLYVAMKGAPAPILYRRKGNPLGQDVLDRLNAHDVEGLYIDAQEEPEYYRYIEHNLRDILSDTKTPLDQKSELMYGAAQNLMQEAFSDPRTSNCVERSGALVQSTINTLLYEDGALHELLKVASFDYYTYTHSVNVFTFSVSLAMRLELCDGDTLLEFGMGTLLHDIGKYKIDSSIVNCRGKLSQDQWVEMKRHPEYGDSILRENGLVPGIALDVVRHHHEKLTGSGYPDGLKNGEIKQLVRVCTIADIFDALTTRRAYKSAVPSFPALKLMKEEMSEELDQQYFGEFVAMMGSS